MIVQYQLFWLIHETVIIKMIYIIYSYTKRSKSNINEERYLKYFHWYPYPYLVFFAYDGAYLTGFPTLETVEMLVDSK